MKKQAKRRTTVRLYGPAYRLSQRFSRSEIYSQVILDSDS